MASVIILIVGRIISGVHWLTDIVGSIFIGFCLVLIYESVIIISDKKVMRMPNDKLFVESKNLFMK